MSQTSATKISGSTAAFPADANPIATERVMAELKAGLSPETRASLGEPLAKRTTLRVGGCAEIYVEPMSETELAHVVRCCKRLGVPLFVLGRGSNLLIRDGGIRGVVVSLSHPSFSRVEMRGSRMECGAGAKLKAVASEAKRRQLTGLEFLEGIPGSVGGALRMNAGAMGGWTFDVVESVRYMDEAGDVRTVEGREVKVEYRSCPMLRENIALGAVLKGQPAEREVVEERMKAFSEKRWDSQPAAASAGCIFKNPAMIPAGRLIDELGLKGTRVGDAVVSQEHGNFIVNSGRATAREVLELIEVIRQKAKSDRGIELQTEVEIVGVD